MENWIDTFTGFLVISSALLMALGVLSCLVLNVFNIRGKARLLICSMLMIIPAAYPIGSLIPDQHKVSLPSEKLQTILPGALETGINTFTYDRGRSAGSDVSPVATEKPAAIKFPLTQSSAPDLYGDTSFTLNWKQAITCAWIFLFVFILMRYFFIFRELRRLVKYADFVTDPTILAVLQQCQNETGLRRSPRLRVVDHTLTPMAVGFLRPAVILPARLLMPEFREGLRFTLLHELKHLQRRDNLWLLLESLVGAVYFFHPVIYWAKRKIHEEWEHICDRHVVQVTNKPASYADFLLHEIWSQRRRMNPSLAMPLIFKARKTKKRVHCILKKMRPTLFTKIRDRIAVSAIFVCFLSIFLFTVTPSASVYKEDLEPGRYREAPVHVYDEIPSMTEKPENQEIFFTDSDSVTGNEVFQALEQEETSEVEANSPHTRPPVSSPVPETVVPKGDNSFRDEKVDPTDNTEKEKKPTLPPTDKEDHAIDFENQPSAIAEKIDIRKDDIHLSDGTTLSKQSRLIASIDNDALSTPPETMQDILNNAGKNDAGPTRITAIESGDNKPRQSARDKTDAPPSKNVAIPIGAIISEWKVIDDRNIIIMTQYYGSFKATLAENCPELSDHRKKLRFDAKWPYELDENSKIILPNDDAYKIQKLVPYDTKQKYYVSIF